MSKIKLTLWNRRKLYPLVLRQRVSSKIYNALPKTTKENIRENITQQSLTNGFYSKKYCIYIFIYAIYKYIYLSNLIRKINQPHPKMGKRDERVFPQEDREAILIFFLHLYIFNKYMKACTALRFLKWEKYNYYDWKD